MKIWITLILCISLSACAGWRKRDMALEGAFLIGTAGDMIQTMHIVGKCTENNPIIGECGQNLSPGVFFPFSVFLHYILVNELPGSRSWILGLSAGVELKTVQRNWMMGDRPY